MAPLHLASFDRAPPLEMLTILANCGHDLGDFGDAVAENC
jgi:hypothetical protein